jgi:hypothetical protein
MAAGMIKAMFGPDASMTSYFGTDGTRLISVSAKSLDEAKQKIDAIIEGTAGIGASPGFQALRERLPKETNVLMAMSAQGLVRMVGQMIGTMTGGEPIAPPADMPKELAFLGGSIGFYPSGYRFDFVLPTSVGPVVEKGLMPIFEGLQGQVNR